MSFHSHGLLLGAAAWVLGAVSSAQVETGYVQVTGHDQFGFNLTLGDDVLAVGAPGDDEAAPGAGALHFYFWDDRDTPEFGMDDRHVHLQKFVPSDLEGGDRLGAKTDMHGDLVLISALEQDGVFVESGAVYVAQRDRKGTTDPLDDEWVEVDKLLPSITFSGQRFGQEVAIHGSTIAVGIRDDSNPNDEMVFVFERDDMGTAGNPWDDRWVETAAIPSETRSRFGWGLEVIDDALLIGARWHDLTDGDDNSGAVFVFFRMDQGTSQKLDDTWVAGPLLSPSVPVLGGQYGRNLEVAGDTLLVGAWRAFGTGAAYVLERDRKGTPTSLDDTWVETSVLRPSDGHAGDAFGNGLSLDGEHCVVGSFGYDRASEPNVGKVYVYARNKGGSPSNPFDDSWPETGRLLCSQAGTGGQVANRVSVFDGVAAVGALQSGVAHLFDLDGRIELGLETSDDWTTPIANGQVLRSDSGFGRWLDLDGNSASGLEAAAFDSNVPGPNFPGTDVDLLIGTGNVLILQESPGQIEPGVYAVPDDHASGGFLEVDFLQGVATPLSVDLIDIEASPNQQVMVTLFDRQGGSRTFFVPAGWTGDLAVDGPPGYGTLDLTTLVPQPGWAATAIAMETFGFLPEEVVRMTFLFHGSGGLDQLCWTIDGSTTEDPRPRRSSGGFPAPVPIPRRTRASAP